MSVSAEVDIMWDHVRPWGNGEYLDVDEIDGNGNGNGNGDGNGRDAARIVGHIIVSGDDALATTIVRELSNAGAVIVKLTAADVTVAALVDAGINNAVAVVCAGADDTANLEIALLARKINATVR